MTWASGPARASECTQKGAVPKRAGFSVGPRLRRLCQLARHRGRSGSAGSKMPTTSTGMRSETMALVWQGTALGGGDPSGSGGSRSHSS